MWNVVGIVAAVVVILLLFQVLDLAEILKNRLRGESAGPSLKERIARLEERLDELENRNAVG